NGHNRIAQGTRRFVLPTSPRRLKLPTLPCRSNLQEATSGRLSSNPAKRSDGGVGVLREARNCTRVAGWRCSKGRKMLGADVSFFISVHPRNTDLPPLRVGRFKYRYLGLKPWAEFFCPFGAENRFPF